MVALGHYRRCDGVALYAADASWRLAFVIGQPITYLPARHQASLDSVVTLTGGVLEALTGSGGVLADLFPVLDQVA